MSDVWLAVASGLLLALAAPGSGIGVLAWIALVPLFRAIAGVGTPRAAFLGWLAGFGFAASTLWWIGLPVAAHSRLGLAGGLAVATAVAAAYAVPYAAYAAALAFYERRLGAFGITLAATLWSALEWSRTLGPLPLPWCLLGYTQPARASISQIAEWTGVYGPSALVVIVNAAIHVGTTSREIGRRETGRRAAARLGAATLVVAIAFGAGEWLRSAAQGGSDERVLRIGVVQPALPPGVDSDARVAEGLTRELRAPVDLVVWPEGAAPFAIVDEATYDAGGATLAGDRRARDRVLALARELRRPIVTGAGAVVIEVNGRGQTWTSRNRVVAIDRKGEVVDHVDKRILVPFGEIVPFGGLRSLLTAIVPGHGEYRPGNGSPLLRVAGVEAATVICWEAIFPAFVAEAAGQASLILDLTNDAWLGGAAPAEQHFAMAAMRAVEARRPLVRAANSGISAFVGADGTIHRRTPFGARTAIVGEVHPNAAPTFYSRHGDVFAIGAALAAVALLVYAGGSRPHGDEPVVLPVET